MAYPVIPTGCTVFHFPVGAFPVGVILGLDVRGGAPAHIGDYGLTDAFAWPVDRCTT